MYTQYVVHCPVFHFQLLKGFCDNILCDTLYSDTFLADTVKCSRFLYETGSWDAFLCYLIH